METLRIKQTFTVGGRTFDTEPEAQAYALTEQRKRQAVEILSTVRRIDRRRNALEASNETVVAIVADNLEAFAQIVALLEESRQLIELIEREALEEEGRAILAGEVQ